ncbi:hypothetical protein [Streptomyces sp. NRRL F-2664]|uniref:hypothetical protein n=1 Tax=Streptomyces sp. NRRL F-2664 TaxID=1463842 RepID=UPI0004C6D8CC|nr:hypothetical protein [Streptomyces sp. NRRL F-2664]
MPSLSLRNELLQDRRDFVRDNRSDIATLGDNHGRAVDTESWGRRWLPVLRRPRTLAARGSCLTGPWGRCLTG